MRIGCPFTNLKCIMFYGSVVHSVLGSYYTHFTEYLFIISLVQEQFKYMQVNGNSLENTCFDNDIWFLDIN